jgi:hypothetical protein
MAISLANRECRDKTQQDNPSRADYRKTLVLIWVQVHQIQ